MEFKILEKSLSDFTPIESEGQSFTPIFGYGSKRDLQAWLRSERKDGEYYYPLVWLMVPFTVNGDFYKYSMSTMSLEIIVATLTDRNLSNKERVRITFENTLEPLVEEVVRKLRFGDYTGIVEGQPFEIQKHFGYDTDPSSMVSDIWDAITLKCTTKIKYC
jgi:hypothetical protein